MKFKLKGLDLEIKMQVLIPSLTWKLRSNCASDCIFGVTNNHFVITLWSTRSESKINKLDNNFTWYNNNSNCGRRYVLVYFSNFSIVRKFSLILFLLILFLYPADSFAGGKMWTSTPGGPNNIINLQPRSGSTTETREQQKNKMAASAAFLAFWFFVFQLVHAGI